MEGEMNLDQPGRYSGEQVWTHSRIPSGQALIQELEQRAIISHYQRNEPVYREQNPVESWYRIVAGAARRFVVGIDGKRQIVDLLLPGDFFGFGVRGTHPFTAEAVSPGATIARYPIACIERIALSDPQAARELFLIVLDASARIHAQVQILGRTTAEQKVGSFLLYLRERLGDAVAERIALPISRYDVADYLALSAETVSRSLNGLQQRGVIALSGPRQIGIVDPNALADERESEPVSLRRPAASRSSLAPPTFGPRTRPVEIRIPVFAFTGIQSRMRQWLDREHCELRRFSCVREDSGVVSVRIEFAEENEDVARAFEDEFGAASARPVVNAGGNLGR
jgi:CRP/FNR family nitrogen fixation transcriptional regulator